MDVNSSTDIVSWARSYEGDMDQLMSEMDDIQRMNGWSITGKNTFIEDMVSEAHRKSELARWPHHNDSSWFHPASERCPPHSIPECEAESIWSWSAWTPSRRSISAVNCSATRALAGNAATNSTTGN